MQTLGLQESLLVLTDLFIVLVKRWHQLASWQGPPVALLNGDVLEHKGAKIGVALGTYLDGRRPRLQDAPINQNELHCIAHCMHTSSALDHMTLCTGVPKSL